MEHSYYRDRISAYHDRELPPQEQAIVEEHIRGCTECQQLLAELERLDKLVAQHAELAGGDYWEKSARKIEERLGFTEQTEITSVRKAGWDKSLVWKISAIAATLAVLVFIGINRDKIMPQEKILPNATPPGEIPQKSKPVPDSASVQQDRVENKSGQPALGTTQRKTAPATKQPSVAHKDEIVKEQEKVPPSETADNYQQAPGGAAIPAPQQEERAQPLAVEPRIEKTPLQETTGEATSQQPETATKRKSVRSVESQASRTVNRAPASSSLTTNAQPVDSVEATSAELDRWRSTRDSLANLLKADDVSILNKYSITSLVQKADNASRGALRSAYLPPRRDKSAIEKAYLQACYEVALQTTDAGEYRSSRGALEKTASDQKSPNADVARQYLDRLRAERPSPPEK